MPPMPVGLAYIASNIDERSHELKLLDLMFVKSPQEEIRRVIKEFQPEIIGVSIRNLDNQDARHTEYCLPAVKELVETCKKYSHARIIVGGTAFTTLPEEIFNYLNPHLGIVAEGERVFPELVNRIEQTLSYEDLPGLVFKTNGKIQINQPLFANLDGLPLPKIEHLDYWKYREKGGLGNVLIKLGCPFECAYCDAPQIIGDTFRKRPIEAIIDEIEIMQKRFGIRELFFNDPVFNIPIDYAKDLCRELIGRKLAVGWICTFHPSEFDRELIELMKKAGCRLAVLSPDTGSPKMLAVLQKGFDLDRVREACQILENLKLDYVLDILLGGPGEDRETVKETFNFLKSVRPTIVNFTVGLRILPGTKLAQIALDKGIISTESDLMKPKFYISPEIKGWIGKRIWLERVKNPSLILRPLIFLISVMHRKLRHNR